MTEAELEELLSRPTPSLVTAFGRVHGDLLILGAGGKMGPSLARLARRASDAAGTVRRIVAVARFSAPGLRESLEAAAVETIAADLFDPAQREALPDCPNVIYMVGQKFGTRDDQPRTWAVNGWLPGAVAQRLPSSRIVAFSTGNVYPLWPTDGAGPDERVAPDPVGEYAQSALARERVLEFFSRREGTPMALLRLNYAIEPRYGVLHDIGQRVFRGEEVDLAMGAVNVIWQRDANAIALMALAHTASPPLVLNVTGRPAVRVRDLAATFAARFGRAPRFRGAEAATALLSDASAAEVLFGPPPTTLETMVELVAGWIAGGGRSLGKPTHFEERGGAF